MNAPDDFLAWMDAIRARTEAALARRLPAAEIEPRRLHAAMRYAALAGGKRLRPLLAHATGEMLGADAALLDDVACAVELIHAYSLVHDDLPAMDNDVLRRGRPTCHVEFDEATAILAGDALQCLAFELLAAAPLPSAERRLTMLQLLAKAAGSRGMAGGQALDLAAEGRKITLAELEFMHLSKTGALIRAALLLGAHCGEADAPTLSALSSYAARLGLLYQVVDDILDAEGDTATLGKTAGKDAARKKATTVSLLGIARAREWAAELETAALDALSALPHPAARLVALTRHIACRRF